MHALSFSAKTKNQKQSSLHFTIETENRFFQSRMALAARQCGYDVPVRSFAKGAGGAPQALKGDELLKGIFFEVTKKFETALGIIEQERIKIDPKNPAAVAEYAKVMKTVRQKRGLVDELGAETMMMDALDKVEKELKTPLMRNYKKGMALHMAEFDKINPKLGIRKEDLPKYKEQLELKGAQER